MTVLNLVDDDSGLPFNILVIVTYTYTTQHQKELYERGEILLEFCRKQPLYNKHIFTTIVYISFKSFMKNKPYTTKLVDIM